MNAIQYFLVTTPSIVAPLPEPYTGWQVLAIDADDFGAVPSGGITVKATLQGAPPLSINGQSFQADTVTYSQTGEVLGLDPVAYPDGPTRKYLLLPPKSLVRDRSGAFTTRVRFDSVGLVNTRGTEAIQARLVDLTEEAVAAAEGSLWKLLQANP